MNEMNSDTLNWEDSTWKKVSLPLFISSKNKIPVGMAAFFVSGASYIFTNHYQFLEPRLLPFTTLDQSIPFLPWTVWVYTSEYSFFIIIYLLCRSTKNLNRYFYALVSLQFVSLIIFMLWPTTYPRHLYPLPDNMGSWTHYVFSTLRNDDSPVNCAPSLHVSSVILSSLLFLNEQREKLPFFLTWASLIALSTLTTKQHYIVDVVSGLIMALVFHWIFYRKITYYEIK